MGDALSGAVLFLQMPTVTVGLRGQILSGQRQTATSSGGRNSLRLAPSVAGAIGDEAHLLDHDMLVEVSFLFFL